MNFGEIDRVIIFGGTQRVVNLIWAIKDRYDVVLLSSERLLQSYLVEEKTTLEEWLAGQQIDFHNLAKINEFDIDSVLTQTTLGISLGAPWIFTADFIAKFQGRLINGHGAKLPQDRGAGDFSWQIMRGLNFGYHLFHEIDPGIDTGNILLFSEFLFPHACRTPDDFKQYSMQAEKDFFKDFFQKVKDKFEFKPIAQQEYFSTYFPRLSTVEHGLINWNWKAQEIEQFVQAFDDPYPGASTFLKGKRVHLKKMRTTELDGTFHPFMNGLVYRRTDRLLFIATAEAGLIVEEVFDENGEDMIGNVSLGDRFWTSQEKLDSAMTTRVAYDAKGVIVQKFPIK